MGSYAFWPEIRGHVFASIHVEGATLDLKFDNTLLTTARIFKASQEHCIFIYLCHQIGATLGPQLGYFGDGKRSHNYGHFTVTLINNTACIALFQEGTIAH